MHTARTDADILRLIREAARVGPGSRILDVACGPGLVALHLAEAAGHVTGLDITPAMIDKARDLQLERGGTPLTQDLEVWRRCAVLFATIKAFKGLEADAMIITDLKAVRTRQQRSELYVACSRAKHLLCLYYAEQQTS